MADGLKMIRVCSIVMNLTYFKVDIFIISKIVVLSELEK